MLRFMLFFAFIYIIIRASNLVNLQKDDNDHDQIITNEPVDLDSDSESDANIEEYIQKIEQTAIAAEKSRREGIIPLEQAEILYDEIAEKLDEIIISLANIHNAYKFLNAKGIQRVILPNISTNYAQVKRRILTIIKILFDVIPNTANASMPNSLVDRMLDVFENDDDLDFKGLALDILYIWLPNNPKLQARVMKLKGLEPFYQQMSKLDLNVNQKLLSLFNKILQEHITARNNLSQKTKTDYDNVKLYQMIGLIERMSTPYVCNGFLNVIEIITLNENVKSLQMPIIELIKNVKPFCFEVYKGKKKAINMFQDFYEILFNERAKSALEEMGLNVTEIKLDIQNYLMKLKENIRIEL